MQFMHVCISALNDEAHLCAKEIRSLLPLIYTSLHPPLLHPFRQRPPLSETLVKTCCQIWNSLTPPSLPSLSLPPLLVCELL